MTAVEQETTVAFTIRVRSYGRPDKVVADVARTLSMLADRAFGARAQVYGGAMHGEPIDSSRLLSDEHLERIVDVAGELHACRCPGCPHIRSARALIDRLLAEQHHEGDRQWT